MAVGVVGGLVGVLGRNLRKRQSITVLLLLVFSLSLIRNAKHEIKIETREEKEEEKEDGEEYITSEEVMHALRLLDSAVSTVEAECGRMVTLGGSITCSCEKKLCGVDGAKMVCLDPDVMPPPRHCHAFNFGIGYEFSFDEALVNYGCRVFAFDPTNNNVTNRVYQVNTLGLAAPPRPPSLRRAFHALNLGLGPKDHTLLLNLTEDGRQYRANVAAFLTYKSVLRILDTPRVDIIKIDIEGVEWQILQEILSAPNAAEVLRNVRQILMEVHFDFLKPGANAEELLKAVWRALAVLRRLKELGFHLASFDLNNTGQKFVVFGTMRVALFREVTLIRRGVRLR
ncbi:uncharacterized protein LOC123512226 [Portunus trituberculatus]|uniref:uncharacterized protein LOC123512226 n=1 Tax=Portunus trituberculatus TaxID=210409 RepID=UPI001E1D0116|nr:uncharacterized protein LOC123512226 [Portunus trituberculatus]